MELSIIRRFSVALLSLIYSLNPSIGSATVAHEDAERDFKPAYRFKAAGRLERAAQEQPAKWPVNILSIGHTMASYQNYGSGPYFHHGIDIRAEANSDVIASRGGKVINIENYVPGNSAYWEVAIEDKFGFVWQYHHIRHDSIPQVIFQALKEGSEIADGTKIGKVYSWMASAFGERFHHIHLNVLGDGGRFYNPLYFLEALADEKAPEISKVGVSTNGRIYVEAKDLILHDRFFVPPYLLQFSLNGDPFKTVWQFDSLPGGASETDHVHDFFVEEQTCGNYSCRRFAMNLEFGGQFSIPQGENEIRIHAADFYDNQSEKTFIINVP